MSKTFEMKDLNVNHKNGGRKCRTLMIRTNRYRKFASYLIKKLEYFDDYITTKVRCSSLA
jgi:hypothetical protein